MRVVGVAMIAALALAPAALAAGPPPLSSDTARVDIASDHGAGVFGDWRVDAFGLPAYRYTIDEAKAPAAAQPELAGSRLAWHQLGNDHVVADAFNDGFIQLWSQDRSYEWTNKYDPANGHYAGGYGYLNVGGKAYSTLYADRPAGAETERDFGVGYARRSITVAGLDVTDRVYSPFGDDPVLLHDVVIHNPGAQARKASWFEYWDIDPYIPAASQHTWRGTAPPAYDAATKTLSVAQLPNGQDQAPLSIFLAPLRGTVDGFDTSADAFFGSGGRAAPAVVAADKPTGSIAPPSPDGVPGRAMFALRSPVTIPAGGSVTLRYVYGYAHPDKIAGLVTKWRGADDAFGDTERAWAKWLPQADYGPSYAWLSRELQWDAYMLRSGATYEETCGHHIISQGGYYQYDDGSQIAYRDPLQHMLPMIYADPSLAREVILYSAQEQPQAGGQIAYGTIPMCQRLDLGSSDDLDFWLLLAAAEYGLGTHDTRFFDQRVRWQDSGDATLWDHLKAAYQHQESLRGPHGGYVTGATGDWSDFSTQFMQMTESMLVTAQTAYAYPQLAALADERGDSRFAAQLRATTKDLDGVLKREWTGKGWFSRGYSGDRQLGQGVIYEEPQPWALLAGAATPDQDRTLVANIKRFLTGVGAPGGPAKIGSAQSPAKNDPDVTEGSGGQDGGVGNNHAVYVGGSWYALNGPLVWALGNLDQRDYAWDEFLRNSLAQHATVYPNHWDGVLSVDDACREWYSTDPADCGVGLTTNYDTQIMHQPAWALVDAVKLAGLEPVAGGYRVIPRVPMKTFSLRLPDAGVAAAPGVLRGYVTSARTIVLHMSVAGPADGVAYANGRRVASRAHDGLVDFDLPAQADKPADWAVAGAGAGARRSCASRRRFAVHLRGARLRRVEVLVGGRRVRVARRVVDLRGLRPATVRVRLVGTTRRGRRVVRTRRYRTCVPRRSKASASSS